MQNIVFQRIRSFELLIIRKEENAMCLLQEKCIGLGREGYRETRALKKEGTEKVSLQLFKELNLHIACILFGYVQIFCTLMP